MEFFFGAFTEEWERRKAALLHDMTLDRRGGGEDEDEYWRRMGGAGGGLSIPVSEKSRVGARGPRTSSSTGRGSRPMRARFTGIARGSQSAVVKMASYGGGIRLGAMLNYVSRAGEVEVEDDRGERIQSRERLSSLRGEWEHLFQNREESRDIGVFSVTIEAVADQPDDELQALVRETLSRGFGERRFAYGIARSDDGSLSVNGVVVLRSADGERLTGDAKATEIVQERYDTRSSLEDPSAVFSFAGYGNGVDYGTSKLRRLVEVFDGNIHDERGVAIENDAAAGDLVQKDWRHELHSRKSRDVMHLIMSARAGTDVDAFKEAARDFLGDQFAGHRYVFALHDPTQDPKEEAEGGKRPHVHVHAIITMKSEFGERIETSPQVFRAWRSLMAEKAREHGINMEMTDRRELATAPAFGRNQVRPVSRQGRTEHVGTSDAAHSRYQAKRSELPTTARARRSVDYAVKARQVWQQLAVAGDDHEVKGFAAQQESRLETAFSREQSLTGSRAADSTFGSKYRANMVWLEAIVSEAESVREMSRPEFEAYEKRVETALFKFERLLTPEERTEYEEVATAARDHVNVRREILELNEERSDPEHDAGDNGGMFGISGSEVVRDGADGATRAGMERIESDEVDALWEAAVIKHGEKVVERANNLLIEVDAARERIDRAQAEGRNSDSPELDYASALNEAAGLALAGNSYMREVAETDEDLRRAVEAAERSSDARADPDEQQVSWGPDGEQRRTEHRERSAKAGPQSGETSRSDPAQQHVPPLEELERKAREDREQDRDRDDFER
ncbi:relaxase/mobilization nuclease domain-containing protein [Mesorhizobium sp. 2RAF21]|uniref:relaxase/mobilization nuclease domain-containing protein n=1 Tax=Mesorhizobium sp. 2RAF21 TaxID=3232995 RepID=UPI003F96C8AE